MEIIDGIVDVLCVGETKIDSSFPTSQFSLEGYHSPYRLDISNRRSGLLVYVNPSIPTRQLKSEIKYKEIQIISLEINLGSKKRKMTIYINLPSSFTKQLIFCKCLYRYN